MSTKTHDFWVIIDGACGEEWESVIGTRKVPVRTPIPVPANLPGYEMPQPVYFLAVERMSARELGAIVVHLARKFGMTAEEGEREMQTVGIPILAENCSVMILNPQRWMS